MKRCLLISPLSFYSWHSTIAKELERKGYQVTTINDEYPQGLLGLVLGKYVNALSRALTYRYLKRFLHGQKNFDLVLIFKGRGLSERAVKLLKQYTNRVVAYNFDSFAFFGGAKHWFQSVDKFCSFDYKDCDEYGIERVDLFTDNEINSSHEKTIDVSCVMKNHSSRLKYLDVIHTSLKSRHSFNVYIFEKNLLTLLSSFLRHPWLVIKWFKFIHFKSLGFEEYTRTIGCSKVTIDFAHPKQSGLTMRTFQSAASGTGLITNNAYASSSTFLSDIPVFVFTFDSSAEPLSQFIDSLATRDVVPRVRNVQEFLDELLSTNEQ